MLAASIAVAAYVFAHLGLFSLFRVADPSAQSLLFFRVFGLGLVAGLFWDVVLKRIGEWLST